MIDLWASLLDQHISELRQHLFGSGSVEQAAYVLFGKGMVASTPWHPKAAQLLVSHSVEKVNLEAVIHSTASEITWKTDDVIQKLKLADEKALILGIVHNHTGGQCEFSNVDFENEAELTRTIQNRNGPDAQLASLLFTPDGKWRARLWSSPKDYVDATETRVVGQRILIETDHVISAAALEYFSRQTLAFGDAFNAILRQLRVTVVGCGGTGSAVATLLARLGVGALTLIDDDTVEETNLNRLHGATRKDADESKPKVRVVADTIRSMGLGTKVFEHKGWVSDAACRDLLKSSHIVFGCTDDHAGRVLLNRLAYYYQIPVIDMGLAVQLSEADSGAIQAMDGRVTVLLPGEVCLLCRSVIDPRRAGEEALKRQNPEEYEKRKAEAYVLGEENPSPGVITFTTELACMAVNEMIHRLQGFRGEDGSTSNRVRLFHRMTDLRPSRQLDAECRICGTSANWCRGDTEPFLEIVS